MDGPRRASCGGGETRLKCRRVALKAARSGRWRRRRHRDRIHPEGCQGHPLWHMCRSLSATHHLAATRHAQRLLRVPPAPQPADPRQSGTNRGAATRAEFWSSPRNSRRMVRRVASLRSAIGMARVQSSPRCRHPPASAVIAVAPCVRATKTRGRA
eukprot:6988991-Prymnesium_polylepis.1